MGHEHLGIASGSVLERLVLETVYLWQEMAPYLLLGMVIAGLLHVYLGRDFILRHLGKNSFSSIIKATLLGIPLPVCSCGVIPIASSLRKDGASRSSVLAFMVSTPTTGVDSILATYSLIGPLFAVFRPLAALISGIVCGSLDYFFAGKEKDVLADAHKHPVIHKGFQAKEFFRYTFLEIPADIGKWLIIGTLLGGAISALIPSNFFHHYLGFPFDFIAALAVGIPLYVCATGSIPIAASLIAKGFSPGAALVFLIAGPATNTVTLFFVHKQLGKRSFWAYLLGISLSAVLLGILFNQMWAYLGSHQELVNAGGQILPNWLRLASSVMLLAMIAWGLLQPKSCAFDEGKDFIEIRVLDADCRHCRVTLESKLRSIKGVSAVEVDINRHLVKVQGDVNRGVIEDAIKDAGFHV